MLWKKTPKKLKNLNYLWDYKTTTKGIKKSN